MVSLVHVYTWRVLLNPRVWPGPRCASCLRMFFVPILHLIFYIVLYKSMWVIYWAIVYISVCVCCVHKCVCVCVCVFWGRCEYNIAAFPARVSLSGLAIQNQTAWCNFLNPYLRGILGNIMANTTLWALSSDCCLYFPLMQIINWFNKT